MAIADDKIRENLYCSVSLKYEDHELSICSNFHAVTPLVVSYNPAFFENWISEMAGFTVKKK